MIAAAATRFILGAWMLAGLASGVGAEKKEADPWILKPVIRPEVPAGMTDSKNAIDAFIASEHKARGLKPAGPATPLTLLRRVHLDLVGIPPAPAEQAAFVRDPSPDAYEKVVDRLLASEQHAVRYARHWLDVFRYADADERMVAAPGIYLWRDWMIHALHEDIPYDEFVRVQLTGYRPAVRTQMSAVGFRGKIEPRPDDLFALGFLARGAVGTEDTRADELAISAVETVSTAFMGMTVGCAKCHDHMYDPIKQADFYAMKALFDPLTVRKVTLATAGEIFTAGENAEAARKKRLEFEKPLNELTAPYKKKLYDERVTMLPPEIQAVIRKPERDRTVAEQKIADDYYPILRIDADKILEVMPEPDRQKYKDLKKKLDDAGDGIAGRRGGLATFWTVETDRSRAEQKSYILTSGDPARPEKNHEVSPGWPFAPAQIDFREGRIEAFCDWLTAPENPLFARVAMNRLWQWHFGAGLQKTPSDFGQLGGEPSHPRLLDWLAAEFVQGHFSMKQMHRLMVTSEAYKLSSDRSGLEVNEPKDPDNTFLWHYRLQRLEAEPIWDSIWSAAGTLDETVGGPSFDINPPAGKRGGARASTAKSGSNHRRAAYMTRGYSSSRDVLSSFLQAFDVDDGRVPCPVRTQTVTAPQSLFMMNSPEIDRAAGQFADRLRHESGGDVAAAVDLAYRVALTREPTARERERAQAHIDQSESKLSGLAWLLFNLDEFVYVR